MYTLLEGACLTDINMKHLFLRIWRWAVWAAIGLLLLSLDNSVRHLNPAQLAASPYLYNIVEWEFGNFLSKWTHRLADVLPGGPDREMRLAQIQE